MQGRWGVYNVTCKGCGETYIGQSSKNVYTRGKEHVGTVSVRGSQAQSQADDGHSKVATPITDEWHHRETPNLKPH